MARSLLVALVATLTLGIPSVHADDQEPEPDPLEGLKASVRFTLDDLDLGLGPVCVDADLGHYTMADLYIDIEQPDPGRRSIHLELPLLVSTDPSDYLEGIIHVDSPPIIPDPPWTTADPFDALLKIRIGGEYDPSDCRSIDDILS